MPRAKAGLKSATESDEKQNFSEHPQVQMRELKSTASVDISEKEGTCEPSKNNVDDLAPSSISDIATNANTEANEENENSLHRKPKRLFDFTGSRKKDAKRMQSADKSTSSDNNTRASQRSSNVETPQAQKHENKDGDKLKKQTICQSYKRHYFDDGHAYEDPSLLVNNSAATPMHMNEGTPKDAGKKPKKMEERPSNPSSVKTGLSKSTESIKAAVKGLKEGHASIMSETSIPRSIFAALVSLLLSIIIFLAVYFLLHCHPVLSTSIAILVYVVIFINLGFMNGRRMKCLILLVLPSVCSRGGRFAFYLLLGYFVIIGPLCNIRENAKLVRNSLKCINNERPWVVEGIVKTFEAAQNCIDFKLAVKTNTSNSIEIECLNQRCLSTKAIFQQVCGLKDHKIAPTVCSLSAKLSCMSETFSRNRKSCPERFLERYCDIQFHEILKLVEDVSSDDDVCRYLEILSMLFPLLILFVLYEGYTYENKYRTYNDFHNYFLTGPFQVIDQSRSSCDRDAVLPLRKVELRKHVRPATILHLTNIEKKELWSNLKSYLVALVIILILILADLYMFHMFEMNSNGSVAFDYNANIVLTNLTEDNVVMNNTVQSTNKSMLLNNPTVLNNRTDFAVNATSSSMTLRPLITTDTCLVNVDPPGSISKIILPILLSLLLLVISLQAHVSRLQWYICSQFYTMRERERVFYLYNKILEDRIQLMDDCRKKMKCFHRETKTLNTLEVSRVLSQQIPWLAKIFNFFHVNLKRCVICHDTEKPEFKECHGLDCSGVYCLTCFFDIDKKCLYCDTELKHSLSKKQPDGKDRSSKESLV